MLAILHRARADFCIARRVNVSSATRPLIVRELTCSLCGAPRTADEESLIVICRHCGATITYGERHIDLAEMHARGVAQMVKPSLAQARLTSISLAMATLHHGGEEKSREEWRLLAEEQVLLSAIVYPSSNVAPLPTDPQKLAAYLRDAVVMQEIATFDPRLSSLMAQYGNACGGLTRGDPLEAARAMLVHARAYYAALIEQCPAGMLREGAEHHARELVRRGIDSYASLLGERAIERIRVEVLGDRETVAPVCPKCGGPLPGERLARCPHCNAVTDVETEDAWLSARLSIWKISLDELVRGGRDEKLTGVSPVIAAIGGFLYTNAADVSADKAAHFLRLAIPWVALEDLDAGIGILRQAVSSDSAKLALLDAIGQRIHASEWTPDLSSRPSPRVHRAAGAATQHPEPTEADEAAWIEATFALYKYRPQCSLIELLGYALSSMQIAAVHDQPTGLSPRAAIAFFERANPGFDRAAMLRELVKLQPGYDHPRVAAFTAALANLLST